MKKARSPGFDAKENDQRAANHSPLFAPDGPRSPGHLFSRFVSKPLLHAGLHKATSKESSKLFKASKRDTCGPSPQTWKPNELEKAKASLTLFKRSFKGDKADQSIRVASGVVSERHSTEFVAAENSVQNSRISPFRLPEAVPSDRKPAEASRSRNLPLNFGGDPQQMMGSSATNSRIVFPSEKSTKRTTSNNPSFAEAETPCVLAPFLDKIDRKFASLRNIFGSENQSLNRQQFTFFLAKLGWIGELDRNFEVQKEEDGRLVDLLFAGVSGDGREAYFPVIRRLLASVAALFEHRLVPKAFEQRERVLCTRMTDLSSKKTDLGSGEKPVAGEQEQPKKLSVARVQSCTSTPTQLAKMSAKFDSLTKPVIFPSSEQDMQFSFRKTWDPKLPPLPEPEVTRVSPLSLDYVDASQLHSVRKLHPVFAQSEEKHSSPDSKPSPASKAHLQKGSFDLGTSICESRVIESDVEAALERNLVPTLPDPQAVRPLVCELAIKLDNHCEIVRLFEGDDIGLIARDFVTKWRVPDKELLVLEGLTEAYNANLPKPK